MQKCPIEDFFRERFSIVHQLLIHTNLHSYWFTEINTCQPIEIPVAVLVPTRLKRRITSAYCKLFLCLNLVRRSRSWIMLSLEGGVEGAIMWQNMQGTTVSGLYLLLTFNIT